MVEEQTARPAHGEVVLRNADRECPAISAVEVKASCAAEVNPCYRGSAPREIGKVLRNQPLRTNLLGVKNAIAVAVLCVSQWG